MLWHFDFKKPLDAYKFFDREVFKLQIANPANSLTINTLFAFNEFVGKTVSLEDQKITLTAKED